MRGTVTLGARGETVSDREAHQMLRLGTRPGSTGQVNNCSLLTVQTMNDLHSSHHRGVL